MRSNDNGLRTEREMPVGFLLCLHFVFIILQGIWLGGISDPVVRITLSKILQVLACLLPVVFFRYSGAPATIKRKLRINCMPAFPMFFISLAVMCGALLINVKLCELLSRFGVSYSVGGMELLPGVGGLVFALFMYVLLPAVCEELFFRYALLQSLGGGLYAVIISALCFSLMHFNLFGSIYTFVTGLVLGCTAIATGSLILPVLLHGSMNGLALLLSYLAVKLDAPMYLQVESIIWSVVFLGGVVFAVFTLLNFNRQQNELVNLEKNTDEPAERRNTLTILVPIIYIVAVAVWNLIRMIL